MAPFQIAIQKSFKPFSQKPGSWTLIPGSIFAVEAFPSKLRFYQLKKRELELYVDFNMVFPCPLESFTVMLDLERKAVEIHGNQNLRPFRLKIIATKTHIELHFLKLESLFFNLQSPYLSSREGSIQEKDILYVDCGEVGSVETFESCEKLSLGCHKKQDIDNLSKKPRLHSLLPLWLKLASFYPPSPSLRNHAWSPFLLQLQEILNKKQHDQIEGVMTRIFKGGFSSILCPRLYDKDYQGLLREHSSQDIDPALSPLIFLKESGSLIRSLFIQYERETIRLLPHLPPEFFCGRFINISTPLGRCHLEWTKKMVRRVIFSSSIEGIVNFQFPSSHKNFRLRCHKNDKGSRIECGQPFEVKSGLDYFLDQFQK